MSRCAIVRLGLSVLGLVSQGCRQGSVDEVVPEPELAAVLLPGEPLLAGDFEAFALDGTTRANAALVGLLTSGGLKIASFGGGAPCEVAAAERFQSFRDAFVGTSEREPIVMYLEAINAEGRGTLHLVDLTCQERAAPIADAELPLRVDDSGFFVKAGARDLHFIDPWHGVQKQLSAAFEDVQFRGSVVWVRETDEVVVFHNGSEEAYRMGRGVRELIVAPERVVMVDADGITFFHPLYGPDSSPRVLDADACGASLGFDYSETTLVSYLSPCESQRLVVFAWPSETRYEFSAGVSTPVLSNVAPEFERVRYLTDASVLDSADLPIDYDPRRPERRVGTLWSVEVGEQPVLIAERTKLASVGYSPLGTPTSVRLIADFDGKTGRLIDRDPSNNVTREILPSVVAVWGGFAFVNFSDGVGELVKVPDEPGTNAWRLGTRVPDFGVSFSGAHTFLSDFDGYRGTLNLLGWTASGPKVIAAGVPRDRYGAAWQQPALVYVSDVDPATGQGTLAVSLRGAAPDKKVRGVSTWLAPTWPEWRLLYNQKGGARAGIWSANVECRAAGAPDTVPCPGL